MGVLEIPPFKKKKIYWLPCYWLLLCFSLRKSQAGPKICLCSCWATWAQVVIVDQLSMFPWAWVLGEREVPLFEKRSPSDQRQQHNLSTTGFEDVPLGRTQAYPPTAVQAVKVILSLSPFSQAQGNVSFLWPEKCFIYSTETDAVSFFFPHERRGEAAPLTNLLAQPKVEREV